jgi:hypothetical protein
MHHNHHSLVFKALKFQKKKEREGVDFKVKHKSLTSLKIMHPDFAIQESHLSCQGQQPPKIMK